MTFKIGNIVRVLGTYEYDLKNIMNKVGIVVDFLEEDYNEIGVEFNKYMKGHDCEGHAKEGYGWYLNAKHLKLEKVTSWKERIEK